MNDAQDVLSQVTTARETILLDIRTEVPFASLVTILSEVRLFILEMKVYHKVDCQLICANNFQQGISNG